MSGILNIPSGEDSWAKVELFRWQYGVLPAPTDFRPLNVAEGLRKMSAALMAGCQNNDDSETKQNMPNPFNVCCVMDYVAGLLDFVPSQEPANSRPIKIVSVGRNEPCPCGSGRKYKKCHGGTLQ